MELIYNKIVNKAKVFLKPPFHRSPSSLPFFPKLFPLTPNTSRILKSLFAITFGILIVSGISSQGLPVPALNPPLYNGASMDVAFSNAGQLGSIGVWDNVVLQSFGYLRAQWENQIENTITTYVNTITTQDSYNSVSAYQEYVRSSLEAQKQQAYLAWEASAEADILSERGTYLTARYGASFSETSASQATFLNQLNNLSSTPQTNASQQTMSMAQSQWTQAYNANLQSGLLDFNNSMNSMVQGYQSLVNQLNQTDANFQTNLAQIRSYETQVKAGISGLVTNMRNYMNGEDLFWNHNSSNAKTTLNTDGLAYKTLLDQMDQNLSTNAPLSTLANTMKTFLQTQSTLGQVQVTNYTNAIYASGSYNPGALDAASFNGGNMWSGGDVGLANAIAAYYDGSISMSGFMNWLNSQGGYGVPSGKQVVSVGGLNLQARNSDNNYCHNGVIVCLATDPFGNHERYYSNAGSDFLNYYENDVWLLPPAWGWFHNIKQQDSVIITLSYTTYDAAAAHNAQVWGNLVSQLNNFNTNWTTNVIPAITAWESQVSAYQASYAAWQTQKTTTLTNAQASLAQGIQSLYNKEADWIANMENLKAQAEQKWTLETAALSTSSGNDNSLGSTLSGLFTSLPNTGLSTGAISEAESVWSKMSELSLSSLVNTNTNLPDVNLLGKFTDSMDTALTGSTNISLLSATNRALLDSRMSYVEDLAQSMTTERMFTDTGYEDLLASKGYSTKEFTVTDAKGSETKVTVLVNSNGNVIGKDGKAIANTNHLPSITEGQKSLFLTSKDFIKSSCGDNLDKCNAYTEQKYEAGSVVVHSDGTITAKRKMHTGEANLKSGGDATNSRDYVLERKDETITIAAPPMIRFGTDEMAYGGISPSAVEKVVKLNGNTGIVPPSNGNTGIVPPSNGNTGIVPSSALTQNKTEKGGFDLFGSTEAVGSAINSSFNNVNKYFSKSNMEKLSASLFTSANNAGARDSDNTNIASHSAQSQSQNAGMVVDLIKSVALGGMSPQAWAQGQVKQMAQSAMATVAANTFHLSPEVASLLSGALLDKQAADKAKNELGKSGPMLSMNRLEGMMPTLLGPVYGGLFELGSSLLDPSKNQSRAAIRAYEEDKLQLMGQAIREVGKSQDMPSELVNQLSQYAMDWKRSNDAKNALGYKGNNPLTGALGSIRNTVTSWAGEAVSGVASVATHYLRGYGVISHDEMNRFNQDIRTTVNDLKHKSEKEAIATWNADEVQSYGLAVKEYGKSQGWSQETIEMYSKAAMEYATREQAKSELSKQNQFKSLTVVGFLDKSLFNDGLTTILAKGLRGVATTLGDITNGLGLLSDNQLDDLYKQSRDWTSSVTLSDLKAQTQTGIVNLHDAQKAQVREMMFTELGKILSPSLGGMDPTQIGQLLKYQMDQKQAKENAKDQRLRDAGTVVSVAAAAALTVATAGGGAPIMTSIVAGTATTAQYVAAVAITAANAGMQAYVAGETGGGNNGAIAGVANAAISTITAGAGSAFTGYVSWTPHRAGNLLTGEDAVTGGWGGGISGSFQGTSGLLKGVGLNGGLSFQPGSGVGVNMNVNFPGTLGLPRGSFLGINYQTGSGDYTASGGFSLYQNGNSSTGISISESNSGYASVGLNYNKDGNSFLNRLQGYSLNIGSDGLLSLHNQFRGADVLSLGYNFNTHSFDPIGINQNFQNDYNNSVTQENAAANAAASAEKLAEKRQEWLDQQRTKPGYEGLSDQAVFDKYKLENSGVGGSRLDLPSQVFGSLGDMFGGSLGLFNSSGEGYLNSQGEFVPRTCFTAGTLVHTATGAKKIEEVKVGDQVLSWDEESGEQGYHRVVKTFQRQTNVVYTLHYSNGTQVETTDEHPFYIENKGWVPAKDLRTGEASVLSNEKTLEIVSITISERTTTVYNFEVEDAHSYYVSEVGILVHNDCVLTGPSMSLEAFNALLKYMPGASEAEIEAARKLIEIGNRPVDGTLDAVFDVAAYIDAACKSGCPPDIAMAPVKLGVSGLKVASELIRSGRFKEALSLVGTGVKNWVKGSDNFASQMAPDEAARYLNWWESAGSRVTSNGGSATLINGVTITDKYSGTVLTGTVDLGPTFDRIAAGQRFPSPNDGTVFKNLEMFLPPKPAGYYREFVVPTPGSSGAGPQRLVIGANGEAYYTPNHYGTFIPIK
nr:TIGR04388 family protein [Leptospira weilii]